MFAGIARRPARPLPGVLCALCLCLCWPAARAEAQSVLLEDRVPVLSARLKTSGSWPEGPLVLLLHGTLSHRNTEIIQSLEDLLAEEGVSTLAPNLSFGVEARENAFSCAAQARQDFAGTQALLPRRVGFRYCEQATVSAGSFLSYYEKLDSQGTPQLPGGTWRPTPVITGSRDEVAGDLRAALEALAVKLPRTLQLQEIEGADHFFRDLYADELVELAIDFIEHEP